MVLKPAARSLLWAVVILSSLSVVGTTWLNPDSTQWDFRIFYYASEAHALDKNPYDLPVLSELAGRDLQLGFVYPPVTLWMFKPFTLLPYTAACRMWLMLKLVLAAFLIKLWADRFTNKAPVALLTLVSLFAFNGSLIWDIRAGNISVLEQTILWTGFAAFARGRLWLFTALVTLAATFKLSLAVFLLLLVLGPGRRWGHLLGGLGGLAALVVLPGFLWPELGSEFLRSLGTVSSNDLNLSSLGLIDQALAYFPGVPDRFMYLLWLIFVAAVLGASFPVFKNSRGTSLPVRIALLTIVYTVVAPRLITYSYFLLVPAIFVVWLPMVKRWEPGVLLVILLCSFGLTGVPPKELGQLWSATSPYPVVLTVFVATLFMFQRHPDLLRSDPGKEPRP